MPCKSHPKVRWIPHHIQKKLGITPDTEVDFIEEDGRFYLVRKHRSPHKNNRFRQFRGIAGIKMSADDMMELTRSDK